MHESPDVPILMYRDFYDVPRLCIIRYQQTVFLLDCRFDDRTEEYQDYFSIDALDTITDADIAALTDWSGLSGYGRNLGRIPVDHDEFDSTRRNHIHRRVLGFIDPHER